LPGLSNRRHWRTPRGTIPPWCLYSSHAEVEQAAAVRRLRCVDRVPGRAALQTRGWRDRGQRVDRDPARQTSAPRAGRPGRGNSPRLRSGIGEIEMIVVMDQVASARETGAVIKMIEEAGLKLHIYKEDGRTVMGLVGQERDGLVDRLRSLKGVDRVIPIER